jgi:hypothetical protein
MQHFLAGADPVHLEEGLWVGRGDFFDRLAGERAQADGRSVRSGGAGDGDFTVGVYGLHSGGTDDDRQ